MGGVALGVLVLPDRPGPDGASVWRRVEELGVDHAWTYDHLSWRSLRHRPWFDAMVTLAAAAMTTERMSVGTLVASPNFRHPVTTAKQVMTLDHVSGGRFLLGLGAGAIGEDASVLGAPPLTTSQRAARFEEFVTLTDLLLRQSETVFHGRFFEAVHARMVPGCLQQPRVPFAIAASGPRTMRLAVAYATIWVTIGDARDPGERPEPEAFVVLREQLDRLAVACHEANRDFCGLRKLVNISRVAVAPYASVDRFADLIGRCGELGFTDVVVSYPRPEGVFAGDPVRFEQAVIGLTGAPRPEGSR